jgi:microcystin-dependent protein
MTRFLILTFFCFLTTGLATAQDKILNYQGVLLDGEGQPVADDTYSAVFELFDSENNGTALWTDANASISTINGAFSVRLGSGSTSIPGTVDFTETLWLRIVVDGSAFGDRVRIDPEPTALSVENSLINVVSNRGSAVPIGTVVAFAGDQASIPEGWLICNGEVFDTAEYPELSGVLSNYWFNNEARVPDLRGMFLRGVDGGSGRDKGLAERTSPTAGEKDEVGTTQDEATAINGLSVDVGGVGTKATSTTGEHSHRTFEANYALGGWSGAEPNTSFSNANMVENDNSGARNNITTSETGNHSHNINIDHDHDLSTSDTETRPINAYVYYIIKAK